MYGGAIPGAIPTDTIKTVDENNLIIGNPVRSNLAAVATPQVFDFKCYKAAVEALPPEVANGEKEDPSLTDDAAIFFRHNHQIKVIFSDLPNHKITYMNDLHK